MSTDEQKPSLPTIHLAPVQGHASEREVAVLRLLGRLGVARLSDVWQLVLLGLARRTVQELLQRLGQRGLIWSAAGPTAPMSRADGRPGPPRQMRVFGLTPAGRTLLDRLGVELEGVQQRWLIARERRSGGKGKRGGRSAEVADLELPQELLTASWCASLLDHARRAPQCVGIQCYTQLVTARDGDTPLQTLSAYVLLAFDPQQRTFSRRAWELPWLDGPPAAHLRTVRLALLTDIGSIALPTLIRELRVFPWLAAQGGYRSLFGEVPRPVLLTMPGDRAREVFVACRDSLAVELPPEQRAKLDVATQQTLGQLVVASTDKAEHPTHGVLWGSYTQVRDGQRTHLLSGLGLGVEQWAAQVGGWRAEERGEGRAGAR